MDCPLRVMTWNELDASARAALMERGRSAIFDDGLRASIGRIIDDVRANGDDAVCRALRTFDGVDVSPEGLRVTEAEFAAARAQVGDDLVAAIRDLIDHVRRFNEHVLAQRADWQFESEPGLVVGEKWSPIASAGLFVPCGKGSFPSVLAQIGTPAVVAGVATVIVLVPPVAGSGGLVDPAVLVTASELGLRDVFRVNGPAGIAAAAFGTVSIPKVVKVLGPGSPPVVCAQLEVQRYGCSSVMLLGPTESLVVADDSADARLLAADLLIEAEHGDDSSVVLVTPSRALVDATQRQLASQLAALPEPRRHYAASALGVNGGAVIVDDLEAAFVVANAYAPEHLQLVVADSAVALTHLHDAGEILVGQHTPFSAANFVIGCPAALPTSGFATVSSGITVDAFLKRTAVASADAIALARMTPSVVALAEHEGFPAHAAAVRARILPRSTGKMVVSDFR